MIITHETTIEEYEAWLATNPDFSEFRRAVRSTFKAAYLTIGRIVRRVKRVKNRSCLSGARVSSTVYPLSYNKNGVVTPYILAEWISDVRKELKRTTDHIRMINLFDCLEGVPWAENIFDDRFGRIQRIEDELAMEQTYKSALEILNQ
ncbi:hypothetical protein SNE25_21240 [Mucilaginibacter sabulilitoris]|uniref:Uncharacterized protein n=1 Tax=Mucilaginibacter sabulilitoris TaxID=1173583 RepID=A0ABZ0TGB2_9SPHI|nr:hypothetical protein [Mucilaginibacter sabulilitoris]WPU91846.1 hypothetical protein SNE25_21240 [Mucilaginibacter sabulilitoris]